MNLRLQNKVILITDSGDFLVSVIARLLEEEGAIPCRILLNSPDNCGKQVLEAHSRYGSIDGLINTLHEVDKVGLENGSYTSFLQSLQLNVLYTYLVTQAAKPWLSAAGGAIINIISRVAETGKGQASGYAAANGSRIGLTAAWAAELADQGIRVNGIIVTDGAAHQEIAETVTFLLSPAATGMQGELIHVDGGYVHLDTTT